jgi:uncharacterized protein (TIGR03435 family)
MLERCSVPCWRIDFTQLVSILDQKLGLVLKSDIAPVQYWVIDHVEKPSEN